MFFSAQLAVKVNFNLISSRDTNWLLPEEEFIERIVLITLYTNSNLV